MIGRYLLGLALALALALTLPPGAGMALDLKESSFLAEDVKSGKLPPVAQRVPQVPSVVTQFAGGEGPGKSGGEINMLMANGRDVRMMVVYGYARLVVYDEKFSIVPDLLERFDVAEGRIFTLYLRKGHKWSDGAPFTTEDFRYWWEDVANNKELSLVGPPQDMMVDGEPPKFEVIDETTLRLTWKRPNANFLPAMAGPSPLYIFRPSHYLKKFHAKYVPEDQLKPLIERERQRNWAAMHNKLDDLYRNENRDLPRLDPWIGISKPPTQRYIFVRNPYYHRVDANGVQLPYLDRVVLNIATTSLIALKAGAGESDLQARYLRFDNYTFLRRGAKQYGFDVHLWRTARGSHLTLYPNLNFNDDTWRTLLRDVRFRRALSLAIDREEVNQALFLGLAVEGNNTVQQESPLFRPDYRSKWAQYDIAKANALLDELGLTKRDNRGIRLLPDGRPLTIIVETAGESTEETDVLQLIKDTWLKAGIKLYTKPQSREILRNRVFSGETMMSTWSGLENGIPTPENSPSDLVPTSQLQLQWPKWGQNFETGGEKGDAIDMEWGKQLMGLLRRWERSASLSEKTEIWHQILNIWTEQVCTIGIVSGVLQPVVANRRLRNVPNKGVYNWDPGAHFGLYRPDTFWRDDAK